MASLALRARLYSWRKPSGTIRHPIMRGFYVAQTGREPDRSGESEQGRQRARDLRETLRSQLGRKPTRREYRAAKRRVE